MNDLHAALHQLARAQARLEQLEVELAQARAAFEAEIAPLKAAVKDAQQAERDLRAIVDNIALTMYANGEQPERVTIRRVKTPAIIDEQALIDELLACPDLRHVLKVTVNQVKLREALEAGAELNNAALELQLQTAVGKLGDLLLTGAE